MTSVALSAPVILSDSCVIAGCGAPILRANVGNEWGEFLVTDIAEAARPADGCTAVCVLDSSAHPVYPRLYRPYSLTLAAAAGGGAGAGAAVHTAGHR